MAKGIKTGGRTKGTPNKKTLEVQAIMAEHDFCPITSLIEIHAHAFALFRHEGSLDGLKMALDSAKELAPYLHAKRKSVEHTFDPSQLEDGALLIEAQQALAFFRAKPVAKEAGEGEKA